MGIISYNDLMSRRPRNHQTPAKRRLSTQKFALCKIESCSRNRKSKRQERTQKQPLGIPAIKKSCEQSKERLFSLLKQEFTRTQASQIKKLTNKVSFRILIINQHLKGLNSSIPANPYTAPALRGWPAPRHS